MDWLGDIDESKLNEVKAENVVTSSALASAPYLVVLDQVFIKKADSGASMFHIEGQATKLKSNGESVSIDKEHEPEKLSWSGCSRSGDEKGNKPTYTDKKSGEEKLLPSVVQIKHFFDAIGVKMATSAPTKGSVEYNGETIDADIFKKLTGKKFVSCVRQYENDYNGEISIKYDIENFLDIDGKNTNGEYLVDAFIEKIEKSPIKKARAKKAPAQKAGNAGEAEKKGW